MVKYRKNQFCNLIGGLTIKEIAFIKWLLCDKAGAIEVDHDRKRKNVGRTTL